MKKAAMISSSLLLKMSVPYRNRTYNRVLGGPRYIHLTKGTNAVFTGFFSLLATVAISMNPTLGDEFLLYLKSTSQSIPVRIEL